MVQRSLAKPVGDGILALFAATAGVTAIVPAANILWCPHLEAHPIYPSDPRGECPKLELRAYLVDTLPGPPSSQSEFEYHYSIWYYRLQTVADSPDHQQPLVSDVDAFLACLLQSPSSTAANWKPSQIVSIPGISLKTVTFNKPVIHDELHHDFDDPALRVDVGELPIVVTGWLRPS